MKKIKIPKSPDRLIKTCFAGNEHFPQGDYVTNGYWVFHVLAICLYPNKPFEKSLDNIWGTIPYGRWINDAFVKDDAPLNIANVLPRNIEEYGPCEFSNLIYRNNSTDTAIYWDEKRNYLFTINEEYHELIETLGLTLRACVRSEHLPLLVMRGELACGVVMPYRSDVYSLLRMENPFAAQK